MKRPAFQFYPADWRNNAKLRRCTFAERGIWLEVMCLMHDCDEYGVLRWTLKEIAQAVGCRVADLQKLVDRGVLKGADPGQRCAAHIFTPTHARKLGDPVSLVAEQPGPLWFSSRMVLDEYLRQVRGSNTRFSPDPEPIPGSGETPNADFGASMGDGSGDGATSSSSSSSLIPPLSPSGGNVKMKRRRQRLPSRPCPETFDVDERMSTWAQQKGIPADRVMPETERFLGHHRAKGSVFADWNQAWCNWIGKAVEYAKH